MRSRCYIDMSIPLGLTWTRQRGEALDLPSLPAHTYSRRRAQQPHSHEKSAQMPEHKIQYRSPSQNITSRCSSLNEPTTTTLYSMSVCFPVTPHQCHLLALRLHRLPQLIGLRPPLRAAARATRTPSLLLSFGSLGVLGDLTHVGALQWEYIIDVRVWAMCAYACLSVVLACDCWE